MARARLLALSAGIALACSASMAAPPKKPPPAPTPPLADILRESPPTDWRPIEQARMLYMQTPRGRVLIELAPAFAPNTIDNIRKLARAGFFDHVSIVRVQDNFVVQWGAPDGQPPPSMGSAKAKIEPEFTRPSKGLAFTRLGDPDPYAPESGGAAGFAAARDVKSGRAWLTHCYGTVAVARDTAANTGNGSALYAVIGPARNLDRNLAVVGRVIDGMPLLASLPRGDNAMGFYAKATDIAPIKLRFGSETPAAEQVEFEALRTDSKTFATVVEARRNRRDAFYTVPAGGVDVCNVPLPVRPAAKRG
jgi:peptidylprolyl isomerase